MIAATLAPAQPPPAEAAVEAFPPFRFRAAAPLQFAVHFTRGLFDPGNPLLGRTLREGPEPPPARWLCCLDAGLAAAQPELAARIRAYAAARPELELLHDPLLLPGGEAAKNSFEIPHKVLRLARRLHLSRQSHIVAVGGGAFLDAVGFAAALIHRGARLVRVPSTVLAQNDSGVGVKNGLNLGGSKNFLGTFAPPAAVLADFALLATLADRDWIAGIAEAFKVAVIKDAAFLEWLLAHAPALRRRDQAAMERLIHRCATLHLEHIAAGGDPFEQGNARPLDFGHWSAHKLESLTSHELRHGEAVALGIALDLLVAAELGFITAADARRVTAGLAAAGLPVRHEALGWTDPAGRPFVLQGIEEFREHLGGRLAITLPNPLGARREIGQLDEALLRRCLARLAAGPGG
ncbi:MAG: 3-dehydroquinate synthase [Lentisphaeria bacterium]|jgi:3-dehydroquinate synthase